MSRARLTVVEPALFEMAALIQSPPGGPWIGTAISNTSHSNKASSTIVKRARLTGKDQGRWQCCHNKYKKFPYQPRRDVSLLS